MSSGSPGARRWRSTIGTSAAPQRRNRAAALREIRRVLRPGGRAVLATAAADSGRRLMELHDEVARQLGYRPAAHVYDRFNLGHMPLVEEILPDAQLKMRTDAFLFPDVDTALAYYASALIDKVDPLPPDGSHRPRLLQMVAPEIQKILDIEGVFRVAKNAGCFVWDKDPN